MASVLLHFLLRHNIVVHKEGQACSGCEDTYIAQQPSRVNKFNKELMAQNTEPPGDKA